MKSFRLLVLLLAWGTSALAQSPVERAIALGGEGRWDEALETLMPAMGSTHQYDARAWYILGFVHKERFKGSRSLDPADPKRLASIQAFQRCRQLAPISEEAKMSEVALEFLAESFFQDAHAQLVQFTPGDDELVLNSMRRYEATWSDIHPAAAFVEVEFDVYHRLAEANSALLDPALALAEPVRVAAFDRAIAHYERAAELQPEDERTRFNLAVTWYNEGVRKIRAITGQVTLSELMRIQAECVHYFQRSLLPMEAAYVLNPKKLSTLNGLMIIHRALEQREESARFQAELEALKGRP